MTDLLRLIDPDILLPSTQSRSKSSFWLRFVEWADKREVEIGPRTLEALLELSTNPPNLPEFSSNDFWSVLGKFAVRLAGIRAGKSSVCIVHVGENYEPKFGEDANAQLLLDDLSSCANDVRTTVETDSPWRIKVEASCATCATSRISVIDHASTTWRRDLLNAARQAFLDSGLDITSLSEAANALFPRLTFSGNAWTDCRKLEGDTDDVTRLVIQHLAVLNDEVPELWVSALQTNERQDALRAMNVEASLESVRTRASERFMKQRDFSFDGVVRRCEWHTKLYRQKNRIHFCVDEGRVYVGTITNHLSLPG